MKVLGNQGKFKRNSIRTKLMLMMVSINLIIIGLLSFGAYYYYESSFISEIGTNRADVLSLIADRVKVFKSNAYTISNLYYYDETFQQQVENLTEDNKEDFFQYMDDLTSQYKISFNQINLDYYIVFMSRDDIGYCSDAVPEDYDYMNPKSKLWYNDLYNARGDIVDIASYKDKMLGVNSFTAARTVLDGNGQIIGYLMINVNERQIFQTYEDIISEGSSIYIADDGGRIVSSNESSIIGFNYFNMENLEDLFMGKVYMIADTAGKTVLFTRNYEPVSGFTVFEQTSLSKLLPPIMKVRNIVLLLGFLALCFGLTTAWIFSKCIAWPIEKLKQHVQNVEAGNMNETFDTKGYAEIVALNDGIENMLSQIRGLMESEKIKESQKRKIEMNLLQAQINPHFMYNTLFSIKCMVDMHENDRADQMITSFIQLLRSTLTNPEELDTIHHQVEVLRQYIYLQKFRYGDKFEAFIECDESVEAYKLPKLLLQPLIENAILHGVETRKGDGIITVVIRGCDGDICIEVEDNGVGMTERDIRRIMQKEEETDRPHIGIKNVNDRIKLHFGSKYGLKIMSKVGVGTKITIHVPAVK